MHEAGLMQQVLKTVQKSALENNIRQVTKITLSVGKLTMALPEALRFAFDALSRGTMFAGAELEIEQQEPCLKCSFCKLTFFPPEIDFRCPACASTHTEILAGHELYILSYEGEAKEIEGDYCPEVAPGK